MNDYTCYICNEPAVDGVTPCHIEGVMICPTRPGRYEKGSLRHLRLCSDHRNGIRSGLSFTSKGNERCGQMTKKGRPCKHYAPCPTHKQGVLPIEEPNIHPIKPSGAIACWNCRKKGRPNPWHANLNQVKICHHNDR